VVRDFLHRNDPTFFIDWPIFFGLQGLVDGDRKCSWGNTMSEELCLDFRPDMGLP
jgi:hypothetical protein